MADDSGDCVECRLGSRVQITVSGVGSAPTVKVRSTWPE